MAHRYILKELEEVSDQVNDCDSDNDNEIGSDKDIDDDNDSNNKKDKDGDNIDNSDNKEYASGIRRDIDKIIDIGNVIDKEKRIIFLMYYCYCFRWLCLPSGNYTALIKDLTSLPLAGQKNDVNNKT